MAVPTSSWSETSPAGSDQINAGDNAIRLAKTQIREVVDVDHNFPSSGSSATTGIHKKVSLTELADIGTGASGLPILGAQTISGAPELVYTTEADVDIQITNTTGINAPSLTGVYPASNVAVLATIINFIYPVGSFYANDAVSTNPGTLFGVGTWVAVEEQVIAGYKSGSTEFGAIGTYAGGEKQHTLTRAEIPPPLIFDLNASSGPQIAGSVDSSGPFEAANTGCLSGAHNNIQPTYVAYLWRRVS